MELHNRVGVIDTLLEEAAHKRTALTHALHAQERAAQGQESTPGAPRTEAAPGLQDELDLWQQVEHGLTETRKLLAAIEGLERERGVSP